MAEPDQGKYYDHRYSGFTLEPWSCHHPNDVYVKCDDGADSSTSQAPLPPASPPPPSPTAPPPAPCADAFCRVRKVFAEHNPLEYPVYFSLLSIAYAELWQPTSPLTTVATTVFRPFFYFVSGFLQLTPTLTGVFDKVVARSSVVS